jgi:peroxiredoxin
MVRKAVFAILASVLALVPACIGFAQHQQKQGQIQLFAKAPNFSAKGADGKTYQLSDLTKSGPVYLLFIKKDCPITADAIGLYNDLYKAYGTKAPIYGILSGDANDFTDYNKEHHLPFTTLLDPKLDLIHAFKVETSPWMIEIRADRTIGRTWQGYSQDYLQQMNKAVATAAGATLAKVNFSSAPKDPAYG